MRALCGWPGTGRPAFQTDFKTMRNVMVAVVVLFDHSLRGAHARAGMPPCQRDSGPPGRSPISPGCDGEATRRARRKGRSLRPRSVGTWCEQRPRPRASGRLRVTLGVWINSGRARTSVRSKTIALAKHRNITASSSATRPCCSAPGAASPAALVANDTVKDPSARSST